jgi:hypothetical protein
MITLTESRLRHLPPFFDTDPFFPYYLREIERIVVHSEMGTPVLPEALNCEGNLS